MTRAGFDGSANRGLALEMSRENGAGDGTRTRDLLITNQLLYQLSYAGTLAGRPPAAAGITNSNTETDAGVPGRRGSDDQAPAFWR